MTELTLITENKDGSSCFSEKREFASFMDMAVFFLSKIPGNSSLSSKEKKVIESQEPLDLNALLELLKMHDKYNGKKSKIFFSR